MTSRMKTVTSCLDFQFCLIPVLVQDFGQPLWKLAAPWRSKLRFQWHWLLPSSVGVEETAIRLRQYLHILLVRSPVVRRGDVSPQL